jgi:hypothetical protein
MTCTNFRTRRYVLEFVHSLSRFFGHSFVDRFGNSQLETLPRLRELDSSQRVVITTRKGQDVPCPMHLFLAASARIHSRLLAPSGIKNCSNVAYLVDIHLRRTHPRLVLGSNLLIWRLAANHLQYRLLVTSRTLFAWSRQIYVDMVHVSYIS